LKNGGIQTVGTDHCPFFFSTQKQRGRYDFTLCPNGAPGVELRMQLMFSAGFAGNFLPRIAQLCCSNPAGIFGLGGVKGEIAEGFDADFIIFDQTIASIASKSTLKENVDYTPYEGIKMVGAPVMTILRGVIISKGNSFLGKSGYGAYQARSCQTSLR
jgi:dihydropyrimidinase